MLVECFGIRNGPNPRTIIGRLSLKFQWNPNAVLNTFDYPNPNHEGDPDPNPNAFLYVTLILLVRYIIYWNT